MFTTKGILYTAHSGGVMVFWPTPEGWRDMTYGGVWNNKPPGFIDAQIALLIDAGIPPANARRFCRAIAFGGNTTAEAYLAWAERQCPRKGTAPELVTQADLPPRAYRACWARSPNGGPVGVDLRPAQSLHWIRLRYAADEEDKRRSRDLWDKLGAVTIDTNGIRTAIRNARDEHELFKVWPDDIPRTEDVPPEFHQLEIRRAA